MRACPVSGYVPRKSDSGRVRTVANIKCRRCIQLLTAQAMRYVGPKRNSGFSGTASVWATDAAKLVSIDVKNQPAPGTL